MESRNGALTHHRLSSHPFTFLGALTVCMLPFPLLRGPAGLNQVEPRGTRFRNDKSYTTSSTFLTYGEIGEALVQRLELCLHTLYLMLSLRLLSESFFKLRIWKPA